MARTGRPPKEITKNVNLGLRISEDTARKLRECADSLQQSRTQIIEQGINLVYKAIK